MVMLPVLLVLDVCVTSTVAPDVPFRVSEKDFSAPMPPDCVADIVFPEVVVPVPPCKANECDPAPD